MDTADIFNSSEYKVVKGLRLLDDDLMCKVFDNNIPATELVINIILERDETNLLKVIAQKVIKGLNGNYSVTLDIYAVDKEGRQYDIEIQRADKGAVPQRARLNSAMMDTYSLKKGHNYTDMKNNYIIFITEHDVLKGNLPIYHIDRVIRETGESFNDGAHILFVNGAYVDDKTEIGKLMHDFRCTDSSKIKNPYLKERVQFFKDAKEGATTMCKAVEDYGKAKAEEGIAEGIRQSALAMLKKGLTADFVADTLNLPNDEVETLQKTIE